MEKRPYFKNSIDELERLVADHWSDGTVLKKLEREKLLRNKMDKRAQEARNDLVVWYGVCFAVILGAVLLMYGLGFLGDNFESGSLIEDNKITAAAIAVPADKPVERINNSGENSTISDG